MVGVRGPSPINRNTENRSTEGSLTPMRGRSPLDRTIAAASPVMGNVQTRQVEGQWHNVAVGPTGLPLPDLRAFVELGTENNPPSNTVSPVSPESGQAKDSPEPVGR